MLRFRPKRGPGLGVYALLALTKNFLQCCKKRFLERVVFNSFSSILVTYKPGGATN